MDIPVQGDIDIGVAQNLRQAFQLKAKRHAEGGEGVPQRMKRNVGQSCFPHELFEAVLIGAGIRASGGMPGKQKAV